MSYILRIDFLKFCANTEFPISCQLSEQANNYEVCYTLQLSPFTLPISVLPSAVGIACQNPSASAVGIACQNPSASAVGIACQNPAVSAVGIACPYSD